MKTKPTTLHNEGNAPQMTELVPAMRAALALRIRVSAFSLYPLAFPARLLSPAVLLLPAFGAQAGAALTTLHSFTGGNDGGWPAAGLVQGGDGNFYGTTEDGGAHGCGTVFQITPNGALTSLHSFTGIEGAYPVAGLVQGSDGYLYGTTEFGGTQPGYNGPGIVFKISTSGALTTLHLFAGGNDGANPVAGLVQGSDGNFYGTTFGSPPGPWTSDGTVFKISTNGALQTLHAFGGQDGYNPSAALVQGSDGNFYGTTEYGGNGYNGTVFKISTNGVLTTLHSFNLGAGGCWPNGLVQDSDGNFYGTTSAGGTYATNGYLGYGTVFKITTNGVLTSLYSFTGGNGGANPVAGLVQGSDGNFYGTTAERGTNGGNGTVFKISTDGALTSLHSFTGGNDGANPVAGLVQGSDGSFYGTTENGGAGGAGTVFRLTVVWAAPVFLPVTLTNGTLGLTWSTEAGGTYQLQWNSDLSSSNWTNLGSAATATGATLSATDSVTNGPPRFYRVVLLP